MPPCFTVIVYADHLVDHPVVNCSAKSWSTSASIYRSRTYRTNSCKSKNMAGWEIWRESENKNLARKIEKARIITIILSVTLAQLLLLPLSFLLGAIPFRTGSFFKFLSFPAVLIPLRLSFGVVLRTRVSLPFTRCDHGLDTSEEETA